MNFDIGILLSCIGTVIALYGVYQNNQLRDHTGAMCTWFYSNPIFTLYFFGLSVGWWVSGLSSVAMTILYGIFTASNWRGLMK